MKKSVAALLMVALTSLSAFAQEGAAPASADSSVAVAGKLLLAANGARLGTVYRVTTDGSAQLIVDGKMVTVPVATLSNSEGVLKTSLSKNEVRKLR